MYRGAVHILSPISHSRPTVAEEDLVRGAVVKNKTDDIGQG